MMATPKTISISRAQAEAARLLVETADKWGEPVPAGVRAMARSLNGTTTTKNDLNGTTTNQATKSLRSAAHASGRPSATERCFTPIGTSRLIDAIRVSEPSAAGMRAGFTSQDQSTISILCGPHR